MTSPGDTRGRAARPRRALAATLLLGALVAVPVATAGCGEDTASSSPSSPASRLAAASSSPGVDVGPTTAAGAVCDTSAPGPKPLPAPARATIERFVAAVDRGDRAATRAFLAPAMADEVLAGLRPVSRLGLLELEDRY
jgi:hypothetical protein